MLHTSFTVMYIRASSMQNVRGDRRLEQGRFRDVFECMLDSATRR